MGPQRAATISSEVNMQRSNAGGTLMSFLVGGLVGAGLGLLFAPQSGRELRGQIGERMRDGALRTRELGDRAAEQGRRIMDDAREGLRWQKERLSAAVDAGRQTYLEEKSQA